MRRDWDIRRDKEVRRAVRREVFWWVVLAFLIAGGLGMIVLVSIVR